MTDRIVKHTPGPWKVSQPSYWIDAPNCCDRGPMHVADARGWGHLTGKGHGAHGMEHKAAIAIQEANARLIAAAPELLDACKFAFAAMTTEGGRERARDVLVAAIAKATSP